MSSSVPEVSPSPSPSPCPNLGRQEVDDPPSGWMQISRKSRKRRKTNMGDADGDDNGDGAMNDNGINAAGPENQECEKFNIPSNSNENIMTTLHGKALFCLHSLDTKWFQGQFLMTPSLSLSSPFPTQAQDQAGRVKTLGLMVKERDDMDECLRCDDNGYREIDLTVLLSSSKSASESRPESKSILGVNEGQRQKHTLQKLACTGGDMLRIRPLLDEEDEIDSKSASNASQALNKSSVYTENVAFDADQIITGVKVERLVRQFFPNLIPASMATSNKTLTIEKDDKLDNHRHSSFLDELPDCAVVIGDMKLTLSSRFLHDIIHENRTSDKGEELW